jgi:uncharacterized membrane protein
MAIIRRNALLLVTFASIALNLFLIGAFAASAMSRPEPVAAAPVGLGRMVQDLEPELRQTLQPQLQSFGEDIRPLRGQMFRAQREVNNLLAEDLLDREAVLMAFEELRQTNMHYQRQSHEQMVTLLAQLDPVQRKRALRFMSGRRNPMEGRPEGRVSGRIDGRGVQQRMPVEENNSAPLQN